MGSRIFVITSRIGFLISCIIHAFTYFSFLIFSIKVKLYVPSFILISFGNYLAILIICTIMISVTELLGSKNFCRVRVGIGRPEYMNDMINYVIGAIPEEEVKLLDKGTDLAKDAIIEMMKNGYDSAMNKFNKKKESKE